MAFVIGPNGVRNYMPDDVAASLVGNGERGYSYANPEPAPAPKPAPKRTTRRTTAK